MSSPGLTVHVELPAVKCNGAVVEFFKLQTKKHSNERNWKEPLGEWTRTGSPSRLTSSRLSSVWSSGTNGVEQHAKQPRKPGILEAERGPLAPHSASQQLRLHIRQYFCNASTKAAQVLRK